jgi:hypothetical protein
VFTYDPTTSVGRCRLLVKDNVQATAIFDDEDYEAFLALEGDVRLAAAQALETIASDEALQTGVFKAGPVSLDGATVSDALLKRAELLRAQAGLIDPTTGLANYAGFDIAETVVDPFSFRERVANERLRDQ